VQDAEGNITFQGLHVDPQPLQIPTDTTVTWVNHDPIPHTVAESGHLFRSPALDTDDTFSWTFTTVDGGHNSCGAALRQDNYRCTISIIAYESRQLRRAKGRGDHHSLAQR